METHRSEKEGFINSFLQRKKKEELGIIAWYEPAADAFFVKWEECNAYEVQDGSFLCFKKRMSPHKGHIVGFVFPKFKVFVREMKYAFKNDVYYLHVVLTYLIARNPQYITGFSAIRRRNPKEWRECVVDLSKFPWWEEKVR